jgi:hypothetical protein
MTEGIFFDRQEDGTYKKTDNWPENGKKGQLQIDGGHLFGKYSLTGALEIIEVAITKNQATKQQYAIIPFDVEPMPKEIKELLRAKTAAEPRPQVTCSFEENGSICQNTYPRGKGRYPNKFCPEHRVKKAESN